jgi:hypothetical protein
MTDTARDEASSDDLTAARELVRNSAKWFVTGLGAIGAILIAGSQLSSVGALPPSSVRFYLAIAGVIVGLLAILWAMWRVVDVLAGRQWTFEDVVREWKETEDATASDASKATVQRSRRRHPTGWFFRDNPSSLGGFSSVLEVGELYDESEPDREGLGDLVTLMNELVDKAATIDLHARFKALRRQIGGGVVLGAAGIILFAWAANPANPDQPAPSLRKADLQNADLRGASLRNADLTGANLTGANLQDADLKGATIKDAIFANTTCPDGTNSDSSGRRDPTGKIEGGTCAGHLSP